MQINIGQSIASELQAQRDRKQTLKANNPKGIKPGDSVRLTVEKNAGWNKVYRVASVGGDFGNLVFCLAIGQNRYAAEFEKTRAKVNT